MSAHIHTRAHTHIHTCTHTHTHTHTSLTGHTNRLCTRLLGQNCPEFLTNIEIYYITDVYRWSKSVPRSVSPPVFACQSHKGWRERLYHSIFIYILYVWLWQWQITSTSKKYAEESFKYLLEINVYVLCLVYHKRGLCYGWHFLLIFLEASWCDTSVTWCGIPGQFP